MNVLRLAYNQFGTIDCEIEHPSLGWVPFTASPDDPEPFGREIYDRAIAGEFGPVAAYAPPPSPTAAERLQAARDRASLSRMEFWLALDGAGLLADAQALMQDPATPRRVVIMWETASRFERTHPELVNMATAMGLTEAQMDAVFGIA